MGFQRRIQQSIGLVMILFFLVSCGAQPQVTTEDPKAVVPPNGAATPTLEPAAAQSNLDTWNMVAVGDSIPYNDQGDCPGCTGFLDLYAKAITEATGHPVKVLNLTQHNGLQIDGLLDELKTDETRKNALAMADIIVVGIAHNDVPWNRNDDPCDGPNGDDPDWSKYNTACAESSAEIFRPKFESLYAQIAALRNGKPTILRTINRYNDWVDNNSKPDMKEATRLVIDSWSAMICKSAEANGFTCADIYHAFNSPDGTQPSLDLLGKDYTHPSQKGNEVIAQVLSDLGYAPLVK